MSDAYPWYGLVDDESLEKLQALGYIASSSAIATNATGPLADPKTKIDLYNKVKMAQWMSQLRQPSSRVRNTSLRSRAGKGVKRGGERGHRP